MMASRSSADLLDGWLSSDRTLSDSTVKQSVGNGIGFVQIYSAFNGLVGIGIPMSLSNHAKEKSKRLIPQTCQKTFADFPCASLNNAKNKTT